MSLSSALKALKRFNLLLLVFLPALSWAQEDQRYRLVFPWIANNAGQWSTQFVVVNHSEREATFNAKAVRADGMSEMKTDLTLAPKQARVFMADQFFSDLGSGTGYSVTIDSNEPNLTGNFLLFSHFSETANSPAAGSAIRVEEGSKMFTANFMSSEQGTQFSAVVATNVGSEMAHVEVTATMVSDGMGKKTYKANVEIPGNQPGVFSAQDLFGDMTGQLTVMVSSDRPLVATGFFFNSVGEPAIVPVQDTAVLGPKIEPLTDDDFHDASEAKIALGRFLFFDKEISGNRNIACVTCHTPFAGSGDGFSLPVGEGGMGISTSRNAGEGDDAIHERVPRNAPPLFNLGVKAASQLFHDGRVRLAEDGSLITPSKDQLLPGVDNTISAQAMFPITSPAEMRGQPGENEIADIEGTNWRGIWEAYTARLMAIEEYRDLFSAAYPDITVPDDVTFAHAGNAIGAFENAMFRSDNSAFDRFLRGDRSAMSKQQQRGMDLFYGKADCSSCHSGAIQTDWEFHAIAMPQIGPGKGDGYESHDDFGLERESGDPADRYKFRTPPLRNVAITAPYGHNGAYSSLEDVVRHHLDPVTYLNAYSISKANLRSREDLDAIDVTILNHPETMNAIAQANELAPMSLTDDEVDDILSFLMALTDPKHLDMRSLIPSRVPSGLPIFD